MSFMGVSCPLLLLLLLLENTAFLLTNVPAASHRNRLVLPRFAAAHRAS
jgi:hypothetical protein